MSNIRILIVEDEQDLIPVLKNGYAEVFEKYGYAVSLTVAQTVAEARKMAKEARREPYDLASLDVNLGDQLLTGLDVLDTLKRFQSAWMVALLTGVETDKTLDQSMGKEKGDNIRTQLRRDAYARFPAERLLVVEKPQLGGKQSDSLKLLSNRLEQIALVYAEISRLRYIFRPIDVTSLARIPRKRGEKSRRDFIETTSLHWQIRFDCGDIRTLPNLAGFKTLHYLLSRNRSESVTPEEALAIEPKTERKKTISEPDEDPVAAYFEGQGIPWLNLSSEEQEKLIRAALSLKFNRYRELREFQEEDDLSIAEEAELNRIIAELGPLADAAEIAYQRLKPNESSYTVFSGPGNLAQDDLHVASGNYDQMGENRRGNDSPAAALFRARMKRVKDCLRENGFADMARHLDDYVMSTGANWSYNPPEGIEWTT